jgi:AraC family transcriptional activator FtrA
VPGAGEVHGTPPHAVLDALRRAHDRGARLASICSGAFVLAAAGLLDGREAATHWRYADLLAARFPRVRVRADVLYLDGGDVLTSAGTAAGIDLCLHLIRSDHGAAVANAVARRMVVAPQRGGGQAQFVEAPVAARIDDDPVGRAMAWALERLAEPIAVGDLARAAFMSTRNFSRRFVAATGTSPARWLLEQRLLASLPLLEGSDLPVEEVGHRVGFRSPAAFRRHFASARGIPPSAHRRAFGQRALS